MIAAADTSTRRFRLNGMRPLRLVAPAVVCLLSSVVIAQAAPLTLDAIIAEAASTNPDLAAARERVRVAELSKQASVSPFLPDVSVGASYQRSGGDTNGVNTSATDAYAVNATARENLFAGGVDYATYRRRQAELDAATANLDAVRATISSNAKTAFARLLYAQKQVDLTLSIQTRRDENVRLVELAYEAGRENKGSYLSAQANAREAQFEVAQARRALRVAQRQVLQVMGRSAFENVVATGTLAAIPPAGNLDLDAIAEQVPAVRAALASRQQAQYDVAIARGQFFPSLEASGNTGKAGSTWPPDNDRWSAGLSVTLPIFQGGRDFNELRSAKAAMRQSGDQSRSALEQAQVDLETAYAGLIDATDHVDVQKEFVHAATVRAEIARSQYTAGLVSYQDWDLIESDLITAQKSNLTFLRDSVIAEADWERTQGKGAVQ